MLCLNWNGLGLLIMIGASFAGGCGKTRESPTEPGRAPSAEHAPEKEPQKPAPTDVLPDSREPVFRGKVEDLVREFKDLDSLRANEKKYEDKSVEVEGLVRDAPGPVEPLTMMLTWEGNRQGHCFFCAMSPEAAATFRQLGKGQKVKVRGKLSQAIVNTVFLVNCNYREEGPNPAIKILATALGKEFTGDGEPAAKKYEDKELFVEGTVTAVEEEGGMFKCGLVKLDAGMPKPMVCELRFKGDSKQIKTGDRVVVKGSYCDRILAMIHYPELSNSCLVNKK
jgi:hypothetical protein